MRSLIKLALFLFQIATYNSIVIAQESMEAQVIGSFFEIPPVQMHAEKAKVLRQREIVLKSLADDIDKYITQVDKRIYVDAAVDVLRVYRAPESAAVLAKHIGYPRAVITEHGNYVDLRNILESDLGTSIYHLNQFPMAQALNAIGAPALPFIVDKALSTDNRMELLACACVLRRANRPDINQEIARSLLAHGDVSSNIRAELLAAHLNAQELTPDEVAEKLKANPPSVRVGRPR